MAVSNTYTNLLPTLFGMVAAEVRQNSVMPRLVMNLSDSIAGTPGAAIQIPDQPTGVTRAVTHDISSVDPTNLSLTATTLTLNNWREAPFTIDDKMAAEVISGTVPRVLRAYGQALAAYIDAQGVALYTGVYNTGASRDFGGLATALADAFTVNATNNPTGLRAWNEANVLLDQWGAPRNDHRVVLSAFDTGAALINSPFLKANERGDQGGVVDGEIGFKLGMQWWLDQAIPTHTCGTLGTTAAQTVKSVASVIGDTTANFDGTMTTNLTVKAGDVFKFANHNQTYVNNTLVTSTTNALSLTSISPAIQVTVPDETAMTILPSHKVNLMFHPDAIAFASRPLGGIGTNPNIAQAYDEVSGLNLRVEIYRQHKQDYMSIDALFGWALVQPKLIARIASAI